MTDRLCPGQHRDDRAHHIHDHAAICDPCRARLATNLAALPTLHHACEAALIGTTTANAGKIRHTPQPGLNLNQAAVDARTAIHAEVTSWSRIVVEERALTDGPADQVRACTEFLLRHVDWIADQDWAPEIARTIADTYRQARAAAYPTPTRRVSIGGCPVDGCVGELVAYLRDSDELLPSVIVCTVIPDADDVERHEWPADRWMALGRMLRGRGHVELLAVMAGSA